MVVMVVVAVVVMTGALRRALSSGARATKRGFRVPALVRRREVDPCAVEQIVSGERIVVHRRPARRSSQRGRFQT